MQPRLRKRCFLRCAIDTGLDLFFPSLDKQPTGVVACLQRLAGCSFATLWYQQSHSQGHQVSPFRPSCLLSPQCPANLAQRPSPKADENLGTHTAHCALVAAGHRLGRVGGGRDEEADRCGRRGRLLHQPRLADAAGAPVGRQVGAPPAGAAQQCPPRQASNLFGQRSAAELS